MSSFASGTFSTICPLPLIDFYNQYLFCFHCASAPVLLFIRLTRESDLSPAILIMKNS